MKTKINMQFKKLKWRCAGVINLGTAAASYLGFWQASHRAIKLRNEYLSQGNEW